MLVQLVFDRHLGSVVRLALLSAFELEEALVALGVRVLDDQREILDFSAVLVHREPGVGTLESGLVIHAIHASSVDSDDTLLKVEAGNQGSLLGFRHGSEELHCGLELR